MKKIGLTFLIVLFVTGMMVEGVQARWHGYYRGWGPRIYLGLPIDVWPPFYPYGYYPAPPVVVRQSPVYLQAPQNEPYYWYYCENPKGYYPYVKNCPYGWMKVVPNTNPETEFPSPN